MKNTVCVLHVCAGFLAHKCPAQLTAVALCTLYSNVSVSNPSFGVSACQLSVYQLLYYLQQCVSVLGPAGASGVSAAVLCTLHLTVSVCCILQGHSMHQLLYSVLCSAVYHCPVFNRGVSCCTLHSAQQYAVSCRGIRCVSCCTLYSAICTAVCQCVVSCRGIRSVGVYRQTCPVFITCVLHLDFMRDKSVLLTVPCCPNLLIV